MSDVGSVYIRRSGDGGRFGGFLKWAFVLPLLIPSICLLLFSPPLWRDTDGWSQIRCAPGEYTILHWPPGYCFGARVPLWAGTVAGWVTGSNPAPKDHFFREPNLTDAGIYGIIISQHLLLQAALIFLVAGLTRRPWVRILLALVLFFQTPLFVYAQTVGSEGLSNILILAFLGVAWRIAVRSEDIRPAAWACAWALLCGLILTRHINAVLCAVLPGFFLGMLVLRRRGLWSGFLLSLLIGVAAIGTAKVTTLALCKKNGITERSRDGYTFQWRLVKFSNLDAATKQAVWAKVLPALASVPELQSLLGSEVIPDDSALKSAGTLGNLLSKKLAAEYPAELPKEISARTDRQLNVLAHAFLMKSGSPFWNIVLDDSASGFRWTIANLAAEPFYNTAYFSTDTLFLASREVSPLPSYKWFAEMGAQEAYDSSPYLRLTPAGLPLWGLTLIALTGVLLLCFIRKHGHWAGVIFSLAAGASGLLLWLATKVFTDQMPRFILPLYCAELFVCLLVLAVVFSRPSSSKL